MIHPQFNLAFDAKRLYFDTPLVKRLIGEAAGEGLAKAGALVRMIARRSMRYVTEEKTQLRQIAAGTRKRLTAVRSSAPGEPPRAIRPHPWIRQHLYYSFDPSVGSVVVGPVMMPAGSGAPRTLEHGGMARIRNRRRMIRRVGRVGEIAVGGRTSRATRMTEDASGNTVAVTYVRLKTAAMADRANRLQQQLYGPLYRVQPIAARPYMGPALTVAMPRLESLWAKSIAARMSG